MNKKEKFALFLGMLSGDGCLPLKHNGAGYRDYATQFYNTDRNLVELFDSLFFNLFKVHGTIGYSDRLNKKRLFGFCKYSKEIYLKIKKVGFPEGVKRDILRVPAMIKRGTKKEKLCFILGILITDGCLRKNESILFHSGSKLFLEDLSRLISEFTGNTKNIREYVQREIYKSYQLSLNKPETKKLLLDMPSWDNGTPIALRAIFRKDIPVRFRATAVLF